MEIVSPILNGIIEFLSSVIGGIWFVGLNYITTSFGPDMSTFNSYFTEGYMDRVSDMFVIIGCTLATSVFIFHLFSLGFSVIFENKNEPIRLLIRYIFTLPIIIFGYRIPQLGLEMTQKLWDSTIKIIDEYKAEKAIEEIANSAVSLPDYLKDPETFFSLQQAGENFRDAIYYDTIFPLISVILLIVVVINLFKLILEIIERYLVVCLMVKIFPTAASMLVSVTTSNIFGSYMRMFVSQLLLLLFNLFFGQSFIFITKEGSAFKTFIGLCFIIAFLRTAQRMDSYMASLGLNVAQTGGGIMESIGGAAIALRGLASGKELAGTGLRALGANTGNMGIYTLGSRMARGGMSQNGQDIMGNYAKEARAHGKTGELSLKDSDAVRYGKSAYNATNVAQFNGDLSSQARIKSAEAILGEKGMSALGIGENGNKILSANLHKYGDLQGILKTKDGSEIAYNISKSGISGSIGSFTNDDGQTLFASIGKDSRIEAGQVLSNDHNEGKISMAELGSGVSLEKFGNDATHIVSTGNGEFDVCDASNETIGHIDGRKNIEYASNGSTINEGIFRDSGTFSYAGLSGYDRLEIGAFDKTSKSISITGYMNNSSNTKDTFTLRQSVAYKDERRGSVLLDGGKKDGTWLLQKNKYKNKDNKQ